LDGTPRENVEVFERNRGNQLSGDDQAESQTWPQPRKDKDDRGQGKGTAKATKPRVGAGVQT